jgi:hypothetical protein
MVGRDVAPKRAQIVRLAGKDEAGLIDGKSGRHAPW